MSAILIDILNLKQNHDLSSFEKRFGLFPDKKGLGLILVIDQTHIDVLKSKIGNEKIKYLQSSLFMDSVMLSCFVFYTKDKCCFDSGCKKHVETVVKCCMRYLPNTTRLVCKTDDPAFIEELKENMFTVEKITKNGMVKLTRINNVFVSDFVVNNDNFKKYIDSQSFYETCSYKFKFDRKVIEYFKTLPFSGVSINKDSSISQKEFVGHLVTQSINSKMEHNLVLPFRAVLGDEESVDYKVKLITFHSHPEQAYIKNNVKLGCPSMTDYSSFLKVASKVFVIMHIVVTIEGLYILSIPHNWIVSGLSFDENIIKIIEDSGLTDKNKNKSALGHALNMSKLKYKNTRFINVDFVKWDESYNSHFLNYQKDENRKCLIAK